MQRSRDAAVTLLPSELSTSVSVLAWNNLDACLSPMLPGARPVSTRLRGLGLRSLALHSPAVYIASIAATTSACQGMDARYAPDWHLSAQAAAAYNACVLAEDRFDGAGPVRKQRELSSALDTAQLAQLMVGADGEAARAHLQLLQQPGA